MALLSGQLRPSIMDIWAGLGKSIVDIIILAENVLIYKNRDI